MASAALSRLETLLHTRKLGMTLAQAAVPRVVMPTGLPDCDRSLQGGWPVGAISEIVGVRSSGRTTLLVSTLATATSQGQVVALVDAFDRFDPRSAAASGVEVDRLLWIRGAPITVEQARPALLERTVQQAVRAFDLILRAGGFGVVALDLADAPARVVRGLPSATWLRLAQVNEGRPTVGLLVLDVPMGRSARGVSLRLAARPRWTGTSAQSRRFAGFETQYVAASAGTPRGGWQDASARAASGLE
jgi:RecA/RadA recombinase